ncbi:hypothetical protein SAMN05216525_106207 [Bradyrhizobium sp. Gha]|nr:hypothetical protein SAMN05216525_106207 [Bradyrhizobium sp. Gha]
MIAALAEARMTVTPGSVEWRSGVSSGTITKVARGPNVQAPACVCVLLIRGCDQSQLAHAGR